VAQMNILVTFAVPAEFAPWRRRRIFRRLPHRRDHFQAECGNARIHVIVTGMGHNRALEAVRHVLPARPDLCISSGLAGALRGEYGVGQILAARVVGEVGEPVAVASHPELFSSALECGARRAERFATSPALVRRSEQKRALSAQADAVEMEGYPILAEAARFGVPGIAIRAISDTVDSDLPYDFVDACDVHGQFRIFRLISQVLRRPSGLPGLLSLARDCRLAARQLAEFLDLYTVTLGDRLLPIETAEVAAQR